MIFLRLVCVLLFLNLATVCRAESLRFFAEKDKLIFEVQTGHPSTQLLEVSPTGKTLTNSTPLAIINKSGKAKISIARFDGVRDRIYSGFVLVKDAGRTVPVHFVESWKKVSKNEDVYPQFKSKKGLQVQMVDDAIALGVKHAALNFNFGQMVSLTGSPTDLIWNMDGREFHFQRGYIEHMDRNIKQLSDTGASVTLILLNYVTGSAALNQVLLHPNYDPTCPNNLSAFNTTTDEGIAWFKACMEFLADRYSTPQSPYGRVVNYVVGNEVNSHWYWANMGHVSMQGFADDYLRTVRLCHTAVRKFSSSARVFLSLEHHWNIRYAGCTATQGFEAHPFLDYFARTAKEGGDFDWHVAFHPYPENLFNCRTWKDKTALHSADTPRITFKNIEMLPKYLKQPELLFQGKQRRVILSEQGFHSKETTEGELLQAAAYCYAYRKIAKLEGIDAFILHRHVDYRDEGGLNLGLWRRDKNTPGPADPSAKKPIYEAFRAADTDEWEKAFSFALPVIGIKSWKEITPPSR